jgi:hypothetical protein
MSRTRPKARSIVRNSALRNFRLALWAVDLRLWTVKAISRSQSSDGYGADSGPSGGDSCRPAFHPPETDERRSANDAMGQGPPGVVRGAGGLLSLDGAAFADNLRPGLAVDPRCGGRGRDQGGNYAHLVAKRWWALPIPVEQGPAYRPESPLKPKEVPAIHALAARTFPICVDARHKAGHDRRESVRNRSHTGTNAPTLIRASARRAR